MRARGLTRDATADWDQLAVNGAVASTVDIARLPSLPEPVQRWLAHALPVDGRLPAAVELRMHGQIRIGAWRRFCAVQRASVAYGFVWAATARMFGLPIVGFDRYTRESGEMRWRLLNLVPVTSASGSDITRSAAGRHAAELLVAIPTVALDARVSWQPIDPGRALARFALGRDVHEITVTVGPSGALEELVMMRWGTPAGSTLGFHVFGATLSDEGTFGGIAIPRRVTAGWHYGTDRWNEGAFIRWMVDGAHYT
jgi:hypothetical protein